MALTKYGKYVSREIIAESKYSAITTPIARYSGCRGGGDALKCEWSCITKPFTMDQEPEVDNERDQFLLFGVHADPRVAGMAELFALGGNVPELLIPFGVWLAGVQHFAMAA